MRQLAVCASVYGERRGIYMDHCTACTVDVELVPRWVEIICAGVRPKHMAG